MRQKNDIRYTLLLLSMALSCAWTSGCSFQLVKLQAEALRAGESTPIRLELDGQLRSGDQFRLQVAVPKPAYVYVLQPDSPQPVLVFPWRPGQYNLAMPDKPFYVPEAGQFMRLDNRLGREKLYIIVSVKNLAESELLQILSQQIGTTTREASTPPPPPPPKIGPAGKTGVRYLVKGSFDSRGIAVLYFSFLHDGTLSQ